MSKIFSIQLPLLLREYHLYRLIVAYRWLALLAPTIALFYSSSFGLALGLYGLAWINTLFQTFVFLNSRHDISPLRPEFAPAPRASRYLPIALELVLFIGLNAASGVWTSPYYLYGLAPLFQSALFFGLKGALVSGSLLTISYIISVVINVLLTGLGGHNWLLLVAYLTCFMITTTLAGLLTVIATRLRQYALTIETNRHKLAQQNRVLERATRRLEHLNFFGQLIQEGNTPAKVEELALQYLNQLFSKAETTIPPTGPKEPVVQILKGENSADWQAASQSLAAVAAKPYGNIAALTKNNQLYWLIPLICKEQNFGILVVPKVNEPTDDELEEKLLLILLSDQLARHLGSLQQSQALAVEVERARLAIDMHDVVAQSLFGIVINLEACRKIYDQKPELGKQRLEELENMAFDTLTGIRAIIYDLWTEKATGRDFANLIETYIKQVAKIYPFKLRFEVQESGQQPVKLGREAQKGLYRLVQEAISNAAKHSEASEVQIKLYWTDEEVAVEVRDNGRGFSLAPTKENSLPPSIFGGLGLAAMKERIERLAGKLLIENAREGGVRVLASLPNQPHFNL